MFKYTNHNLKKIEQILEETGYTIRYERGNFNSGYCLVEKNKVVVVNKFFETEARINSLLEILSTLEIAEDLLSDKTLEFYRKINKSLSADQEVIETEKAD